MTIWISEVKIKFYDFLAKSPVFTHSAATFQGLTTIRAAKAEGKLTEQFDGYQVRLWLPIFLRLKF